MRIFIAFFLTVASCLAGDETGFVPSATWRSILRRDANTTNVQFLLTQNAVNYTNFSFLSWTPQVSNNVMVLAPTTNNTTTNMLLALQTRTTLSTQTRWRVSFDAWAANANRSITLELAGAPYTNTQAGWIFHNAAVGTTPTHFETNFLGSASSSILGIYFLSNGVIFPLVLSNLTDTLTISNFSISVYTNSTLFDVSATNVQASWTLGANNYNRFTGPSWVPSWTGSNCLLRPNLANGNNNMVFSLSRTYTGVPLNNAGMTWTVSFEAMAAYAGRSLTMELVGSPYTNSQAGYVYHQTPIGTNWTKFSATFTGSATSGTPNWYVSSNNVIYPLTLLDTNDTLQIRNMTVTVSTNYYPFTGTSSGTPAPRVILPSTMTALGYPAETNQIFLRGCVEAPDPNIYAVQMECTVGRPFKRYYEVVTNATSTNTLTVKVFDNAYNLVASNSTSLAVVSSNAAPATNFAVLIVGDSFAAAGTYPNELCRRVTTTGGSPLGFGWSNVKFVGVTAMASYPTQKYIGNSGWDILSYTNVGSPFWTGSTWSVGWWATNNTVTNINLLILQLGWNGMRDSSTSPAINAVDQTNQYQRVATFIDKFHLEYPYARVRLVGPQGPSVDGACGAMYGGDPTVARSMQYRLQVAVNSLRLAYQALASNPTYSGYVRFIDTAPLFDIEKNMQTETVAVNSRNAATEIRGTDALHPATAGYNQIADILFRDFVRTLNGQ